MNLSIDINVSREREWINSNGVIDSNSLKWRGKYIYISYDVKVESKTIN